eukprot:jgi/Bigna1/72949/fgenesh1_pg.22_\
MKYESNEKQTTDLFMIKNKERVIYSSLLLVSVVPLTVKFFNKRSKAINKARLSFPERALRAFSRKFLGKLSGFQDFLPEVQSQDTPGRSVETSRRFPRYMYGPNAQRSEGLGGQARNPEFETVLRQKNCPSPRILTSHSQRQEINGARRGTSSHSETTMLRTATSRRHISCDSKSSTPFTTRLLSGALIVSLLFLLVGDLWEKNENTRFVRLEPDGEWMSNAVGESNRRFHRLAPSVSKVSLFCGGFLLSRLAGGITESPTQTLALARKASAASASDSPQSKKKDDASKQAKRKGRPKGKSKKKTKQEVATELNPEDAYDPEEIPESEKMPVTIITGFLGSGKTTMINYVLSVKHGRKIAVVENEFGEVSIDDALVAQQLTTNETILTMDNGCVCCQLRGDLVDGFRNLALADVDYDNIILETTGLADPVPVAFTFNQPPLSEIYRIDGIVTLVDASHALGSLKFDLKGGRGGGDIEAGGQLAKSCLFLLCKLHTREKPKNGSVNAAVQQIAFADRIVLNKLDLVNSTQLKEILLFDTNVQAPIVLTKFLVFPPDNSVVELDKILNISAFSIEKAFEIDPSLIDDFNEMKNSSSHSYGFKFEGELSMDRLNHFMTSLLRLRAQDLFRTKGVLNVAGPPEMQKFVFQGVHEQIQLGPAIKQWGENEKRINKFVFIGQNLPPRDYLLKKLKECSATSDIGGSYFPVYNPEDHEKGQHDDH